VNSAAKWHVRVNLNWWRVLQSDSAPGLARLASFRQGLGEGKGGLSGASLSEAVRSMYQLGGGADEAFERDA
jgi:hypothetical protein